CGKICHLSQIGHNSYFLHHHGKIKKTKLIGQIFLFVHRFGKTMFIQHNVPPPLRREKLGSQTRKDRQIS
ncbi:hypothetical protein, partial [Bacteroides uniformis]|uniref:hypothetical protein n=1 Tax=Bacteroides uniformis TaxID=820 RepID=UPI001AA0DE7E